MDDNSSTSSIYSLSLQDTAINLDLLEAPYLWSNHTDRRQATKAVTATTHDQQEESTLPETTMRMSNSDGEDDDDDTTPHVTTIETQQYDCHEDDGVTSAIEEGGLASMFVCCGVWSSMS